ncbi:dual serine/threonine and tyrosine protein kinase-like isoform X2 [Paramacrobiotus metropolitanus]|nr:dual serine/threonine and tyrosine protein kinase-like isoform X2 [Paramacrobiotus metropolitanus]
MSLSHEIRKYSQICKLLRQNYRDTKLALKELTYSGSFESEFLANVAIVRSEEQLVQSVIENVPTIVIVGQDYAAKLAMVNSLLGQAVLPVQLQESANGWRMLRIVYGMNRSFSLSTAENFEVVDPVLSRKNTKSLVPIDDLMLMSTTTDSAAGNAVLEISLSHELLMSGWRIIVSPSQHTSGLEPIYQKCLEGALPVFVCVLAGRMLSDEDLGLLAEQKAFAPTSPILYVCPDGDPPNASVSPDVVPNRISGQIFEQLVSGGFLSFPIDGRAEKYQEGFGSENELIYGALSLTTIASFARRVLLSRLLEAATNLYNIHERVLAQFTIFAFDIARDVLITPRRLSYVRTKELELYETMSAIANRKQEEIELIIQETVDSIKDSLLDEAESYKFHHVEIIESQDAVHNMKDLQSCMEEIRDLVLARINSAVAGKLIGSVNCLRESFVGTLCRCLESLELTNESSLPSAAHALKQIFNAAYQIQLNAATSSSVSHMFYEKLRTFVQSLRWSSSDKVDSSWKRTVALEMMTSLSSTKLAKNICSQFRERLRHAHELFLLSIRQLECKHADRLEKMEQKRLKVRRLHAPKVSKLALESASAKDLICHGMPKLGREIGRGQYGVVYACESWAGYAPCAVKSVVPPDDKHWNDLAMEFYYTRCIPPHPRIVPLYGSVIDYSYGDGGASMGPAVLFLMERLPRDLHAALKSGIPWGTRLQVAVDVIEGIRFLHSQGLVHRDIKLKNVLLDKSYRAKLSDLGFCKPEALLSGSIVGTPIHMAPEIFTGVKYDHCVDIYAFGILFWFLCSGSVKLPAVFEPSMSKDMLKTSVRKGIRPERLPYFDDECWNLMNACWSSDPYIRPLPGYIEPKLREIYQNFKRGCQAGNFVRETEVVIGSGGSPYVDLDILNRG